MVLVTSHRISRVPRYSGIQTRKTFCFSPTGLSPSLALFPAGSAKQKFCNFPRAPECSPSESYYPDPTAVQACNVQIGLGCFPFARHYSGNHGCFLFLRVLRCFNSPGLPPLPMYSVTDTAGSPAVGFPIRLSSDQRMLAPPRGLSQLATTFIAYQCQGIHRTPLLA